MSFDEQPDGDPHGECAAEIARLEAENARLIAELNTALQQVKTEQRLSFRDQVADLEQQRDEYFDTVAQQAELLAAHKAEMQDWQRQLLSAQQDRDGLLKHRDALLIDLAASLEREDAIKSAIAKVQK